MSTFTMHLKHALALAASGLAVLAFGIACAGAAQGSTQPTFSTPDAAVMALIDAVKANDEAKALAILGPGTREWVRSGDPVEDRAAREAFVKKFDQKHGLEHDGDNKAMLTIGNDDWPFAFPLVKTATGWRFDATVGKRELLARRIGHNELAAMNVMLAIVDAQREYASADRNADGVREYARRFGSTPGKRDGLYWPTSGNEPPSPFGDLVSRASGEGYGKGDAGSPYHGYYFRMLTAQGPKANGGALDYIVRGHMIGGFAAIAWPAQYRNSGVMTFIVNHDGVVYQKDLGPDTAKLAKQLTRFDPGPGWVATRPD